jgi:hypothetical protein
MLLPDRGYDADGIRELAMKKGAWANIPEKQSQRNRPPGFRPGDCAMLCKCSPFRAE